MPIGSIGSPAALPQQAVEATITPRAGRSNRLAVVVPTHAQASTIANRREIPTSPQPLRHANTRKVPLQRERLSESTPHKHAVVINRSQARGLESKMYALKNLDWLKTLNKAGLESDSGKANLASLIQSLEQVCQLGAKPERMLAKALLTGKIDGAPLSSFPGCLEKVEHWQRVPVAKQLAQLAPKVLLLHEQVSNFVMSRHKQWTDPALAPTVAHYQQRV